MSATLEANEIDQEVVKAGLIQRILEEPDVTRRKGEAQKQRQAIVDSLKDLTLQLNREMTACASIDQACSGILHSIATAKSELLKSTIEGKQIRSLQSDIRELKWVKGEPQLPQLYGKLERAVGQNQIEEVGVLKSKISNLQSKIDTKQREIDRLWTSFGFSADTLPKV